MKIFFRVIIFSVFSTGLLGLFACSSGRRVKTHPDPEERIQAMEDNIKFLKEDEKRLRKNEENKEELNQ